LSQIDPTIAQLLLDLDASRERVSELLHSVYGNQDWQPNPKEWSFRYSAAHMAQVELDAVLARAQAVANNENPHYSYYDNTGWDFSHFDLQESLEAWATRRAKLINLVRGLTAEQFTHTGAHDHFGRLTIQRILEIALEHDGEHESQLRNSLIPASQKMRIES